MSNKPNWIKQVLDQSTLHAFMDTFMGYGDLKADTWFIGMEEGGCNTFENIQTRIGVWAKRGRPGLECCAEYYHAIGAGYLFTPQCVRRNARGIGLCGRNFGPRVRRMTLPQQK
jgi:hypothetical protein